MFPLKIFVDIFRSQMIENEHLDCVTVPLRVKYDGDPCAVRMKENSRRGCLGSLVAPTWI